MSDRPAEDGAAVEAVPVRHPGRWVSAAAVLFLAFLLVWSLAHNSNIDKGVIGDFQFDSVILQGLLVTIELSVIAQLIGILIGTLLAVMRLSRNPVLSGASYAYIAFFRGTPLLVQLIFWFNLALLFPKLSFGIPFGPTFFSHDTSALITGFAAALLGLSLNEGAYMAEIVRAGILSVDAGQAEAAQALGMTGGQTMRRIVLPQAMRVIVPPTGNEFINMQKNTSLVSVIAGADLLTRAQNIYSRNFKVIELLIVVSIWYLVLTGISTVGQYYLERRFARGSTTPLGPTPMQRLRRNIRPGRPELT